MKISQEDKMNIYRYQKRGAGIFLILGLLLIVGSFFFCFTATFFKDRTSDFHFFMKVIIILASGAMFFVGLAVFSNGLNEDKAGTKIAFAEDKSKRLYAVIANLEDPELGGYTAVGKLKSAYENTRIAERNDQKLNLMESPELQGFVEAVIYGGELSLYGEFIGKVAVIPLENPQIVKQNGFGAKALCTAGAHQKIFKLDISRRYESYNRILELIEAAPCRVDYQGKKPGDYFTD